jgi:hypothetical protein
VTLPPPGSVCYCGQEIRFHPSQSNEACGAPMVCPLSGPKTTASTSR